jgi:hypothetical protein
MTSSDQLIVEELRAQVAVYERIERLVKAGKTPPDALNGAATKLGKVFVSHAPQLFAYIAGLEAALGNPQAQDAEPPAL